MDSTLQTPQAGDFVSLLPSYPAVVRAVSFICLGIGLLVSAPFVVLIVFDFFLWIWRIFRGQPGQSEPFQDNSGRPGASASNGTTRSTTSTGFDRLARVSGATYERQDRSRNHDTEVTSA